MTDTNRTITISDLITSITNAEKLIANRTMHGGVLLFNMREFTNEELDKVSAANVFKRNEKQEYQDALMERAGIMIVFNLTEKLKDVKKNSEKYSNILEQIRNARAAFVHMCNRAMLIRSVLDNPINFAHLIGNKSATNIQFLGDVDNAVTVSANGRLLVKYVFDLKDEETGDVDAMPNRKGSMFKVSQLVAASKAEVEKLKRETGGSTDVSAVNPELKAAELTKRDVAEKAHVIAEMVTNKPDEAKSNPDIQNIFWSMFIAKFCNNDKHEIEWKAFREQVETFVQVELDAMIASDIKKTKAS